MGRCITASQQMAERRRERRRRQQQWVAPAFREDAQIFRRQLLRPKAGMNEPRKAVLAHHRSAAAGGSLFLVSNPRNCGVVPSTNSTCQTMNAALFASPARAAGPAWPRALKACSPPGGRDLPSTQPSAAQVLAALGFELRQWHPLLAAPARVRRRSLTRCCGSWHRSLAGSPAEAKPRCSSGAAWQGVSGLVARRWGRLRTME